MSKPLRGIVERYEDTMTNRTMARELVKPFALAVVLFLPLPAWFMAYSHPGTSSAVVVVIGTVWALGTALVMTDWLRR